MTLTEPLTILDKLIVDRAPVGTLRNQITVIREQAEAIETSLNTLQQENTDLNKEMTALKDCHAKAVAQIELKLVAMQSENAAIKTKVLAAQADAQDEIRIHKQFEFRRSKHTGLKWAAFCPVCHVLADTTHGLVRCANAQCSWAPFFSVMQLQDLISEL